MTINEFTITDQDGETITLELTTAAGGFYTYKASNGDETDCMEKTAEDAAQWALDSYDTPSWGMELTEFDES